jgi:hypothetical protein
MTIITDDNFNRKAPLKTKAQEVKETMSMSISARIYCERHSPDYS